ncbi:Protein translocase subunit SecA [hydrothermal vent metagenome]|uniref:Protein translocase subunit SecA n=1 Tax=hydrothermal vent metagenome TaxID=652676 RepID=A0A3B0Y897_9ZZZZ
MYSEFENELSPELFQQMKLVLLVSSRLILSGVSSDEFLQWAQHSLYTLAPDLFEGFDTEDIDKVAWLTALNLWNVAPQPGNHFKPLARAMPSRNTPCPCGSGLKYKQCCIHMPALQPFPSDIYWPVMAETMSKKQINALVKSHEIPPMGLAMIADYYADNADYSQIVKMLNPLFEGTASHLNHKHKGLLGTLYDSYEVHYKTDKKKKDLLERMSHHKNSVIRSEAWQYIAITQQEQGNDQNALHALTQAMRANPDNHEHALLELVLLVHSNRIEHAKQRASFWLHKLAHYEKQRPELIRQLRLAQTDPRAAVSSQNRVEQNSDDPHLAQLLEWIEAGKNTPIEQYSICNVDTQEEEEEFILDLQAHLLGLDLYEEEVDRIIDGVKQGKPLPETFIELYPDSKNNPLSTQNTLSDNNPMHNAITLLAPQDIRTLEMQWYGISPLEKPFSVQYEAPGGEEAWHDSADIQWLYFLKEHPQAINSLDILDDITTLIYMCPSNETFQDTMNHMKPLVERAERIIRQARIPANKTLPWIMQENRTALRLLVHNINLCTANGNQEGMVEKTQHHLRLNPEDNHGYRGMLINLYLQRGENQQALALARAYPEDILADILFGQVLAQYRLGDMLGAKAALKAANNELPLIAKYLLQATAKEPKISEYGITQGGKDQAWLYRNEMRESWLQTNGCMAWLKKRV